jgi:cell division protein FtsB
MEKSKNFFIKIDEFIFQRLDFFKADTSFQKGVELLSGLEEKQQKLFAQIVTFSFILIPFIFVLTLWWGNHTAKVNLAVKSQILEQISTLNANKEARDSVSSTYLAPNAIQGKEDLENRIRSLVSANNIEEQKVRVVNFNQISSTSNISKIEATLGFTNFGTQDFSTLIRALVEREKFKVLRINLAKNKTTNLLNGNISLIHLGKSIY